MTFPRNIYVKKVMKLLAFIFEQPSYLWLGFQQKREHALCGLNLVRVRGKIDKKYLCTKPLLRVSEKMEEKHFVVGL